MHRYSVAGHGAMLLDASRIGAYARAIAEQVRPGQVVVELGTGTGLFAILACKAGARRVYAIEADDVIELARDNAAANGCAGSIVFVHELSTRAQLPERADVMVADVRGVLPTFERGIEAMLDARDRFLAPGGRLIPALDRMFVAAAEAPDLHERLLRPWRGALHGVSLAAGGEAAVNDWHKAEFTPSQLVTDPVAFAAVDYGAATGPDVAGSARLVARRGARAHGLAMWFEATLSPGASFSTSPLAASPARVYGHAFFPWPEAFDLSPGDAVDVAIDATFAGGDYVWRWRTEGAGVRFRQSSFLAEPMSAARLRRRSAEHTPALDEEGLIDLAILQSMREGRTLGAIARAMLETHPGHFGRWEDALARVGDLSERYGGER